MIRVQGISFELLENFREGWNQDAFKERYSDVLSKFDYIVGDWGYGQLRLKGFFDDKNQKSTFDTKISTIQDYLYEYCNFGCAYFILRKTGRAQEQKKEQIVAQQTEAEEPVESAE